MAGSRVIRDANIHTFNWTCLEIQPGEKYKTRLDAHKALNRYDKQGNRVVAHMALEELMNDAESHVRLPYDIGLSILVVTASLAAGLLFGVLQAGPITMVYLPFCVLGVGGGLSLIPLAIAAVQVKEYRKLCDAEIHVGSVREAVIGEMEKRSKSLKDGIEALQAEKQQLDKQITRMNRASSRLEENADFSGSEGEEAIELNYTNNLFITEDHSGEEDL